MSGLWTTRAAQPYRGRMEATSPSSATVLSVLSFALAAVSAVAVGAGNLMNTAGPGAPAALDSFVVLAFVVGVVSLAWAVLAGGWTAVLLVRGSIARRWLDAGLLTACFALVALVLWTNPLWGSGSGTAV